MATIPRSSLHTSLEPDWYRELRTERIGDYFGSVSSIAPGETYVTQDLAYIVHRDRATERFSVSRNACAHAGALLLDQPGVHDTTTIRCPIHKWMYQPDGHCTAKPFFMGSDEVRLDSPAWGVWNGYMLGYLQAELDAGMRKFGYSLPNVTMEAFNPGNFVFMGEVGYSLPYPRALMMINYLDGYHVPFYHQKTFDAVADSASYLWEFSPTSMKSPVWYSIQRVNSRDDVARRMRTLMENYNCAEEDLGWASLHRWVRQVGISRPLEGDIFALWATIYGNGYLMPELYEGGLFLAVSYLVEVDPRNPLEGNKNFVEYYVHQHVPEELRQEAYRRFRHAYEQSAREDDEICERLWAAHRLGNLNFNRIFHSKLEDVDHWRAWFRDHYVAR